MDGKRKGGMGPNWNETADFYNRFAFCELEDTRTYLETIGVGEGDTLLDVCCGPGRVSVLAAEMGAQVTGIDSAERMLGHAAENAQARGVGDKCTFQMQDWDSVLVGQNVKRHDVVIACRCRAMMDVEKLSALAKRTAAVQIFADAPSIPGLLNILFDGCGETPRPEGASDGERADRPHMEGRPGEGGMPMPPAGPEGPGSRPGGMPGGMRPGGPMGGPGRMPGGSMGGPGGPRGPRAGRKPSAYKGVIDAVYNAGFDPNVRIMPERFRKTFASRDEAIAWVGSLSPERAAGHEERLATNVAPFLTDTPDGKVEFLLATSAAIIWWDVRGKASENPWILGVDEDR